MEYFRVSQIDAQLVPPINPRGAASPDSSPFSLAGGRERGYISPCQTSELIGGVKSARKRLKALNKGIQTQSLNFLKVKCLIK